MIHENIASVIPALRELGGQVAPEHYERIRQVIGILQDAAEDARSLEELAPVCEASEMVRIEGIMAARPADTRRVHGR